MKTKEEIVGFVDYIEHTLLPDLVASGSEGMVMDWWEAIDIIKQFQDGDKPDTLNEEKQYYALDENGTLVGA